MAKKRIKLVVSDLHVGVGRTLETGQTNTLEEFFYDDKFSEFIDFYTSGEYADHEVELILNGDIFNFLQVDYRGHFLTVETQNMSLEKMQRIVKGHPLFFETLKNFIRAGHQITYIVGNHDQAMLWPKVREYVNTVVEGSVRYKNIVYYFDGIHIEHGHMYEIANRIDPKKFFLKRNVPEPILNFPFGSHFFVEFVMELKKLNPFVGKVRPFRNSIRWNLLNDFMFTVKSLFKLVGYFIKAAMDGGKEKRRQWSIKRLLEIFLGGPIFPDLSHAAKKLLEDERIKKVIFGHSHVYTFRQWNGKEYFNTGTWTEVTSLDAASLGKITKLTYVLIEYPETENSEESNIVPFARLKEWRGYHRIQEDIDVS